MIEKHFEEGWWRRLKGFLESKDFKKIGSELVRQMRTGMAITPSFIDVFRAFKDCPYNKLKVVMMALDPYPYKGVADGLAFSSRYNMLNPPASVKFIMNAVEKECYGGFGIGHNENYCNPDLTRWASQGVLLINTALTTVVGHTGAHKALWQPFTVNLLNMLGLSNTGLIYILLGKDAQSYSRLINSKQNYILKAMHPAACSYLHLKEWDSEGVFLKTNEILEKNNGPDAKILW